MQQFRYTSLVISFLLRIIFLRPLETKIYSVSLLPCNKNMRESKKVAEEPKVLHAINVIPL